jgi:hypothetical protein
LGDRKIIAVLFGLMLLLVIPLTLDDSVFADKKGKKNTTDIIHLGYLQIAAHDLFNVNRGDRVTEASATENENGKLDLSTVLFLPNADKCDFKKSLKQKDGCALYDDMTIAIGGERRNFSSIMVSTASAEVGEKYLQFVEKHGEKKAYKKILKFYHEQLKTAFEESFDLKFPKAKKGEVTNLHNLALRQLHDFIPVEIEFNGELTSLFVIDPLGEKLSKKEKKQQSSPVDGVFDEELISFINLLARDQSFGEQFGFGADRFDEFMSQLEDGKYDKKDEVTKLLIEAFARGINLK